MDPRAVRPAGSADAPAVACSMLILTSPTNAPAGITTLAPLGPSTVPPAAPINVPAGGGGGGTTGGGAGAAGGLVSPPPQATKVQNSVAMKNPRAGSLTYMTCHPLLLRCGAIDLTTLQWV